MGYQSRVGSLGWIDDLTTTALHAYTCIGSYCSPFAFTYNSPYFWPALGSAGVYLVRDGVVPEPSGGALVGLGLVYLAAARRRRNAS